MEFPELIYSIVMYYKLHSIRSCGCTLLPIQLQRNKPNNREENISEIDIEAISADHSKIHASR